MPIRNIYLEDIPLDEARSHWDKLLSTHGLSSPLGGEEIDIKLCLGRVTAKPVWAKLSSPHYHSAAMDGYAVKSTTTVSATETSPITLQTPTNAEYVDTGNPMPSWSDAVIPIEQVHKTSTISETNITIYKSAAPWQHVRPMGEDMVTTELVLPAFHCLRPADLGAIAASGHSTVNVITQPTVAIIPTGDELVEIGTLPKPGQIIEYNSLILSSQIKTWKALPKCYPIVQDNKKYIKKTLLNAALNNDLIILNAGSSKGSKDFAADIISEIGEVVVHGIAVRPGHPVILGAIEHPDKKKPVPIIGVPGYPVSTVLTTELLIKPLLLKWQGIEHQKPIEIKASLPRKIMSPIGDDDFVRVAVGKVGDKTIAIPLARGAGVISSLVRADGLLCIPRFTEGYSHQSSVNINLYTHPSKINKTIIAIGSHDILLDLLSQHLSKNYNDTRLISTNSGSIGGLASLKREECHMSGSHLLDSETGEYNKSYVKQYLSNIPSSIIYLANREQGLIVQPGNPKQIKSLHDLTKPDITFVNRQLGSGTRVLLDYHLNLQNIPIDKISGYDREQYTHLTAAATVSSGAADVAMGIRAASFALGLDFIPFTTEEYDLIIPKHHLDNKNIQNLLNTLIDKHFNHDIMEIPGYNIDKIGDIKCSDTSKL
tara:strand:+ start:211 stop:2175 length:1965 start_codon:yes stop_codon:yes gene_type:complete